MKFRGHHADDKTQLSMTSMIDIVFLLLVFFVMTFKISAQEGDFNVKMPLQGDGAPVDDTELPLKLRLKSNGAGQLQEITLNDNLSFGTDWNQLRSYVVQMVGDTAGPSGEEGRGMARELVQACFRKEAKEHRRASQPPRVVPCAYYL